MLPPTSRFHVLDRPAVAPGKCAVCGGIHGPVVDFGFSLDFYGAVYICHLCLREAARGVDMVDKSEVENLEKMLATTFEAQVAARNMRLVSDEWYNAVTNSVSVLSDHFIPRNDLHDRVLPEAAKPGVEVTDQTAVGESEQDDLFTSSEGSVRVPADSGNGESFVI